jgi:hypothetical protein
MHTKAWRRRGQGEQCRGNNEEIMSESGNTFGSSSHTVIDPVRKWYKRHTGESRYPAAFEIGYFLARSWIPVQVRNDGIHSTFWLWQPDKPREALNKSPLSALLVKSG